jgi:hypothetical protein
MLWSFINKKGKLDLVNIEFSFINVIEKMNHKQIWKLQHKKMNDLMHNHWLELQNECRYNKIYDIIYINRTPKNQFEYYTNIQDFEIKCDYNDLNYRSEDRNHGFHYNFIRMDYLRITKGTEYEHYIS